VAPNTFDVFQDPELRQGLQLYSEMARRRIREISARTEEAYRQVAGFAPMLSGLTGDVMLKQNTENVERVYLGAHGADWEPYASNLRQRGTLYARAGVRLADWTDFLRRVLAFALDLVFEEHGKDAVRLRAVVKATTCLFDVIVQVIGQTFVDAHREIIREQEAVLRGLSTPVLTVGDRVLLAPLIGDLDEGRIAQLQREMLGSVRSQRARVVVLDVTGVAHVDTAVAQRLGACIKAARLMGARVLVSGLSSAISQAMVLLGVDLPGAETFTALEGALAAAIAPPSLDGSGPGS